MQIAEHECPVCHTRLRVRGPLRDGQQFDCPDCAQALTFQLGSGEVVIATQHAGASTPVAGSESKTPQRIAWALSGVILVVLAIYVLGGDRTAATETEPGTTTAAGPADETSEPEQSSVPDEPKQDQQVTAEVGSQAETDDPPRSDVDSEPPPDVDVAVADPEMGNTQVPEVETPVESPIPPAPETGESVVGADESTTEAPVDQAAIEAARKQAAVEAIQTRLSVKLVRYSAEAITVDSFLTEVSQLSATWVNRQLDAETLQSRLDVSVEDATVAELLTAGLKEVDLAWEIQPGSIHIQPR